MENKQFIKIISVWRMVGGGGGAEKRIDDDKRTIHHSSSHAEKDPNKTHHHIAAIKAGFAEQQLERKQGHFYH